MQLIFLKPYDALCKDHTEMYVVLETEYEFISCQPCSPFIFIDSEACIQTQTKMQYYEGVY